MQSSIGCKAASGAKAASDFRSLRPLIAPAIVMEDSAVLDSVIDGIGAGRAAIKQVAAVAGKCRLWVVVRFGLYAFSIPIDRSMKSKGSGHCRVVCGVSRPLLWLSVVLSVVCP